MDHHDYVRQDLDMILNSCSDRNIKTIITTEKDAVRLKELDISSSQNCQILVLKIDIEITKGKDEFFNRLSSLYKR